MEIFGWRFGGAVLLGYYALAALLLFPTLGIHALWAPIYILAFSLILGFSGIVPCLGPRLALEHFSDPFINLFVRISGAQDVMWKGLDLPVGVRDVVYRIFFVPSFTTLSLLFAIVSGVLAIGFSMSFYGFLMGYWEKRQPRRRNELTLALTSLLVVIMFANEWGVLTYIWPFWFESRLSLTPWRPWSPEWYIKVVYWVFVIGFPILFWRKARREIDYQYGRL